ncbi:S8 family serine peptidase [Streptomyces sp. NPDC051211]|uniref:S8 family peptidase n=1 Tax=Streptomyces sp. NPDC051211 TaxID=3154643 RepID=UPI00344C235A
MKFSRIPSRRGRAAVLLAAALVAGGSLAAPATAAEAEGVVQYAGAADAVPGSYIVMLKESGAKAEPQRGTALASRYRGKLRDTYDAAFQGYAVEMSAQQARRLAADPAVATVVQNRKVKLDATQPNPPSWGLDRIDRRRLPLDKKYVYRDSAGTGVTAYVIDTGVRISHSDFGGRARYGFDAIDGGGAADGHGHGTHVAATVAGTTYGVAKKAKIVAVRVLNNEGEGTTAQVVAGINWVTKNAVKPAVVNMSLGGDADVVLDTAVRNSIASGLTYAVAAGNAGVDASTHSPARVPTALTVGSSDSGEARSYFSNTGKLVDLFAPGSDIVSAGSWFDQHEVTMSGTSMAAPHVAGAAALYLSTHRTASPATVAKALIDASAKGSLHDIGTGSPNRLLYSGTAPQSPAGPRFFNGTNQTINDNVIWSHLPVTGVAGKAPSDLELELNIKHEWRGDLRIELVAPDGTRYRIKNSEPYDSGTNVIGIYAVNASAESASGVWKLKVTDTSSFFGGYLDSWALRF